MVFDLIIRNKKKMKQPEPLLMAFQNAPLNSDVHAQTEFKNLQKKHNLKVAIETGTCLGYTTAFLATFYKEVRTVEISQEYLAIARANRLNEHSNIQTNLGSSSELMPALLKDCGNDTFVFLDAHWGDYCPLKAELQHIAKSGVEPVIAIHDFVVPNHHELGYDSTHGQPFTFEWLKDSFDAIYGVDKYIYYYNQKAEGAKRGIIYIEPKINESK